jgi:pilus assembly protein TadC
MTFYQEIASKYPTLKRKLLIAHISLSPEEYVRRNFISALLMTAIIGFGAFMFIAGIGAPIILIPIIAIVAFFILFQIFMHVADVKIRKLAKDIDRDVLFAGRFLLIKLNSGKPLINAIVDASNSYGVANQYFKEIVRDIELGTPLEEALEKASRYSPSEKMRRILFQISNALKIGVDVTNFLEAILDEIAEDQLLEIKNYGRKLSGITLFYMLFAIVIPSLGITMLIAVVSLVNVQIDFGMFVVFLFLLVIIEFIFITIFKSVRPNVNI